MKVDKISAVVVWYNPSFVEVKKIYSYIQDVDLLYIIDNSNENNESLLDKLKEYKAKIIYRCNYKNLGIATALNIASQLALKNGYEWILTMDQDSHFEKNSLNNMKNIDNLKKVGIIAPRYKYLNEKIEINDTVMEVQKVITSGNLLSLNALKNIGFFNEDFFIDQVDFELCIRLKREGYKFLIRNNAILNHELGNLKRISFLGIQINITNHSPIRRYYMFRNILFMIKEYKEVRSKYSIFLLLESFKILIFEKNRKEKIKFSLKGIKDFLKNKKGCIDD